MYVFSRIVFRKLECCVYLMCTTLPMRACAIMWSVCPVPSSCICDQTATVHKIARFVFKTAILLALVKNPTLQG